MGEPMKIPGPDATAEDWGLLARDTAGFRLLPGMRMVGQDGSAWRTCASGVDICADERWMLASYSTVYPPNLQINYWPDPDDPATAGCLLALLGPGAWDNVAPGSAHAYDGDGWWAWVDGEWSEGLTLGRACIAAAEALGRWPGSEG